MTQVVSNKIRFTSINRFLVLAAFMLLGLFSVAQEVKTYDEAIIYGDRLYKKAELLNAKAYYQQALKLKPGDNYAKSKISSIVEKMKSAMAVEDEYYDIIDIADELYDKNKLDEAIAKYKHALKIMPNDEYALTKVRDITNFQQSEKDKIVSFDKAMEAGKTYLADNEFDKAIESYREAAGIFPDRETPVNEINNAINLKSEYKQKEVTYNQKTEEAERYLLIKNYVEALSLYTEANNILPEKEEAPKRIAELKPLAKKQKEFDKQVEKADEYYIAKDFISARENYLAAEKLWPEKSYPADMIAKIDEKIAEGRKDLDNNYNAFVTEGDSLLDIQEYSQATGKYNLALNLKPDENYPKSKLQEIGNIFAEQKKEAEAIYNIAISNADSAFNIGAYSLASEKYSTAININPDDEYPKQQLALIDTKLGEIAALQKLDNEYNSTIQQADNLYKTNNYELALEKYNKALEIKPSEAYPIGKIDAITLLLEGAEKQKQIDKEYNELILLASNQFNQEKLADAKNSYLNAQKIKPYEVIPEKEIKKIDSIIVVKAKLAETKKQFDSYIAQGDSLKNQKEYAMAIVSYNNALALIPSDKSAKQKKQAVEMIQAELKKEAELKEAYDNAIAKGDELFEAGSYELSKTEFEKALTLKNDQEYPKNRLTDIGIALEKLAAEREQRYTQSIVSGDNFFEQEHYEDAVIAYQVASSIKPNEQYPQQKIAECNGFIAEKLKRLSAEYAIAIADADKLYASKIYDKAIVAYRKAGNIKFDETYPTEMIDKISKFIEENSIVDVISSSDTITSGNEERFVFEPIKISVRKSNYIFLRAKSTDGNPFKIIFSYGSDSGKKGGFVVQVVEGEEFNDYIIRVGNQYKWFSEDNNWLTIHPENGNVEITMLRISKGY